MKKYTFIIVAVISLFSDKLYTQTNNVEASPVKITGFQLKNENLSGNNLPWTKFLCRFQTEKKWMDAVGFTFVALLHTVSEDGKDKFAIVRNGVQYANVPGGENLAIMYLSPNATKRFGTPVAVRVRATFGDEAANAFLWKDESFNKLKIDENWLNIYPVMDGVLLNVAKTPWIVVDFGLTPDLN